MDRIRLAQPSWSSEGSMDLVLGIHTSRISQPPAMLPQTPGEISALTEEMRGLFTDERTRSLGLRPHPFDFRPFPDTGSLAPGWEKKSGFAAIDNQGQVSAIGLSPGQGEQAHERHLCLRAAGRRHTRLSDIRRSARSGACTGNTRGSIQPDCRQHAGLQQTQRRTKGAIAHNDARGCGRCRCRALHAASDFGADPETHALIDKMQAWRTAISPRDADHATGSALSVVQRDWKVNGKLDPSYTLDQAIGYADKLIRANTNEIAPGLARDMSTSGEPASKGIAAAIAPDAAEGSRTAGKRINEARNKILRAWGLMVDD